MEKDIDKIPKNESTDIVIRIDDFGGRLGVTIREFAKSERYTGFTKSGIRIPAEKFKVFKQAINSIDEKDLESVLKTEVEIVKEEAGIEKQMIEQKPESEKTSSEKKKENRGKKKDKEIDEMAM